MSRHSIAAVITPEAMTRVHQLFHSEMVFGVHHVWEHGAALFTSDGVELLVERLRDDFAGDSLALQREFSARQVAQVPADGLAGSESTRTREPLAGPRVRPVSTHWQDWDL